MPEPPVATPDHAATAYLDQLCVEFNARIVGMPPEKQAEYRASSKSHRALAAVHALLAERQQDKQRIADVEELRGRLAGWVLGGEGKFVTLSDILDELCRILDGDARAALAVEEDMANG